MKNTRFTWLLFALFAVVASVGVSHAQTIFFQDTFNNGSTVDNATPSPFPPTANSTAYQIISGKSQTPTPAISANDLNFGIASTSSGSAEVEALFSANPIPLTMNGDYIQLTIVFTNTSGGLLVNGLGYLGIGLFNSDGDANYPYPGGMNATAISGDNNITTGYAQLWEGYSAELAYADQTQGNLILEREEQTTTPLANNDQDLVVKGSSTYGYNFPAAITVGSESTNGATLVLATNGVYTEVFTITLIGDDLLAITNAIYSGSTDSGAQLVQYGATNTSSQYLTSGFNGLAFGWYQKTSGTANDVDISSILVSGHSTAVTTPPTITSQPSPVLVATNGTCAFSVTAQGFDVTYQWQRNGTNLINGGNISGATSDQLVISPSTTTDQLSQTVGYDVIVSGAGGYYTNSTTNSLMLIASTNLVWTGNDSDWDVGVTPAWEPSNNTSVTMVFNFGDGVVFNDVAGPSEVVLSANFLSPSSVMVNGTTLKDFEPNSTNSDAGIGGPCSFIDASSGRVTLDVNDTYTGGTLISNADAYVYLENYAGLGTGPVTFGEAGGQLEVVPEGSGSTGIAGDVVVDDNATILLDQDSTYGLVFLGDLSGVSGQTLYLAPAPANLDTNTMRIRAYGVNTTDNANLDLAANVLFASYAASGSQTYNGVISDSGSFMEKGTITYLNGQNTYSGGTTPAQGVIALGISSSGNPGSLNYGPIGLGPLFVAPDSTTTVTGSGMIEASAANITIGNAIQYPSGTNNLTLQFGGTNNLTLSGPFTLQGNDGLTTNTITSRNLEVTNTALTTISGVISDGSPTLPYGLNVSGNGITNGISVLALSANETYTGPTTVTDATVLVNGQLNTNTLTIQALATLGGDGTIGGPVSIQSGGTLAPGNQAIGTLTLNSSLTCASGSTNFIEVSGPGSYDQVHATTITFNGTLLAKNIGSALSAGDNFTIYHASSSYLGNFSAIAGTPGPGLGWSFNSANGVLSVISVAPPPFTVSPKITSITLSGSNVILNGTNAQSGAVYYLLTSTNLLLPLNQWIAVSTNVASGANLFSFTATNAITAHDPHQYYIFCNTNF